MTPTIDQTTQIINDIDVPKGESVNDHHIEPDSKEIESPDSPESPENTQNEDLTDQENIDPSLEIL